MRRPPQTAILSITFVCTIVVLGWNFAEQARRSARWRQQLVLLYSAICSGEGSTSDNARCGKSRRPMGDSILGRARP